MGSKTGLSGAAVSPELMFLKEAAMGDYARRKRNPTAQSSPLDMSGQPRRGHMPRSDFINELIKAREAEYRSVRNLAEMAGVTPAAISKLESGKGPVATLVAVMKALPFQPTALAPAASFGDQLRNRRVKIAKPLEVIAAKAGLSPENIIELEGGGGAVENLLRLLSVIAPKVKRRAPERVYWSGDKKAERDTPVASSPRSSSNPTRLPSSDR